MDALLKETLWKQFGAAIDMLENTIAACPDELWNNGTGFWYNAYHTLFYLDYYLTSDPTNFSPPAPFTLSEFSANKQPERAYTKEELIHYLQFCRNKCYTLIKDLSDEGSKKRWVNSNRDYSIPEILIYNMRHVQHHAGQLNLLLRQGANKASHWISQTNENL